MSHDTLLALTVVYDPSLSKCDVVCGKSNLKGGKIVYSKTCVKRPLKRRFYDRLSLNAGRKYCRMFPLEHSAILSTFIKLPFIIKIFVLSFLSQALKTSFLHQHYTNSVSSLSLLVLSDRLRFVSKV